MGCSRQYIYKLVAIGKLKASRISNRMALITVEILDKDGNLCPNAENDVTFAVEGAGFIAGVDNGSPISMEKFKDNHRKAFYGKCLVVLQNNGEPGGVKVTATADGLEKATTAIKVK